MSKKLTKISIADANGELQELEIPHVPIKQVPTYSNEVASGDGLFITQDKKEMYLNGNLMGVADESYPEIIRNGKRMPMPKVVYATDTYIGHPSFLPKNSPINEAFFSDIPNKSFENLTKAFIRNRSNTLISLRDCVRIFCGSNRGVSLTLRNFTSVLKSSIAYAFDSNKQLTYLECGDLNTVGCQGFTSMFRGCSSLKHLDINGFDTTSCKTFYAMFDGCSSLTSLDVSNFNTANCTDFYYMFSNCSSLTSLDVSNFNTANGTNFTRMFNNCFSLRSLDVSNFNTAKGTNFSQMFDRCASLTSLDTSNFDVSSGVNFCSMFRSCVSLTSLDLSNFNTASGTDFNSMFSGCLKLKTLKLGANFFRMRDSYSIDFSDCPWGTGDAESLKSLKDSLVVNSYDRIANGLPILTLQLSTATKNLLSEDEKKAITAKGYTIA